MVLEQIADVLGSQEIGLTTVLDIALTALLIYWLFVLIRGTRAVSLVIGVIVLSVVYVAAQFLGLLLLSQILQTGAVIGVLAIVVIFQPDIRRALDRIGRTLPWLMAPTPHGATDRVAVQIAEAAADLGAAGHGALVVIERRTPLGELAETGVMVNATLSAELLRTIFLPRSELHDGAVIVRGEQILATGALLPMPETTQTGRFGTRHRAAIGITEQTDAVAVVVSEETGRISLVERGRIVRGLDGPRLERRLVELLAVGRVRPALRWPWRPGVRVPPLRLPLRGTDPEAQAHRR